MTQKFISGKMRFKTGIFLNAKKINYCRGKKLINKHKKMQKSQILQKKLKRHNQKHKEKFAFPPCPHPNPVPKP